MVANADSGLGLRGQLSELAGYRELIVNMTQRDLKLKYKGSVLGVAWSLLNPLLQMAIYTLIFSVFLRIVVVPNYWAFIIGGILLWTFFSSSLLTTSVAFVRNPGLISKVHFPIEVLPISGVLANFVNFLIPLAILLIVLPIGGIHLGLSLVLLPVVCLAVLAMSIGLGLIAASITVFLRDVEHFLQLGIQIFFYATPILYPLDVGALPHGAERFVTVLRLNPLAWFMDSYHQILYYGTWPGMKEFAAMLVFSAACLVGGYLLFARLRPRIAENV